MDFSKFSWAEWLEDTIKHIVEDDIDKIMLVAIGKDGNVRTAYTDNCDCHDLTISAFWMNHEAHAWAFNNEEDEEKEKENEE